MVLSIVKKSMTVMCFLALVALCLGTPSQAVTVLPGDGIPAVAISPAFGSPVPGGIVTDQYKSFGLMFGPYVAAVIDDFDALAWGGVNNIDVIDLLSPVSGFFVLPSTTTLALTSSVQVEVGYAAVGTILLEVFDINSNLLGSSVNDDGYGPHYRTLAQVDVAGIHSFRVSGTTDTWGMNQISFSSLDPVPVPPALLLFGSGLLGLAGWRRFRKS